EYLLVRSPVRPTTPLAAMPRSTATGKFEYAEPMISTSPACSAFDISWPVLRSFSFMSMPCFRKMPFSTPTKLGTWFTLLPTGAVRAVVSSLAESFTQETGHPVQATFGTMGVVRQKLAANPADVVIASDTVLEDLLKQNAVVAGTRTDIARAGVGVGVREGAPR